LNRADRRVVLGAALVGCLGWGQAALAAAVTGYEALADWNALPRLGGPAAGLYSSYNRSFVTEGDANNYESATADGYGVVGSVTGPGAVTRFWMPHYTSRAPTPVRLTIDGTTYNTNSEAIYNGTFVAGPRFQGPTVSTLLGGRTSYEPIPFQTGIKIEMQNAGRPVFYQWNYQRYAAGTVVPSFNGGLTAAQQADRSRAVAALGNVGQNPAGADASATTLSRTAVSVPAGGAVTLADVSGSGQVRSLAVDLRAGGATPPDAVLNGLRVRVRYDGSAAAAIDVPVSQFFGVGRGRADYQSLPVGVAADKSYYSHWPMPYRQRVTIELYNATGSAVSVPSAAVEYKPGAVAADAGYLHADYRTQTTVAGQARYNLLSIAGGGSGRYVGDFLSFDNGVGGTLEGNDIVGVDGGPAAGGAELRGTGLEDAYNGGYYYNRAGGTAVAEDGDVVDPASGATPYAGLLRFAGLGSTDQYRWRIADAVAFTSGLTVDIENYAFGNTNPGGVTWQSTAFYYLVPEPGVAAAAGACVAGLLSAGRSRRPRRRH
jgi:hypothetical protein